MGHVTCKSDIRNPISEIACTRLPAIADHTAGGCGYWRAKGGNVGLPE